MSILRTVLGTAVAVGTAKATSEAIDKAKDKWKAWKEFNKQRAAEGDELDDAKTAIDQDNGS